MKNIFTGIIVGISISGLIGIFLYKYKTSVDEWLADQKERHETFFRTVIVVLLLGTGTLNGVLLDVIDISNLVTRGDHYSRQEFKTIIQELPNYGLSKDTTLADRIKVAYKRSIPHPTPVVTSFTAALLVFGVFIFGFIMVLDQTSDHNLENRRRNLLVAKEKLKARENVIRQIRHIVITKLLNIKSALNTKDHNKTDINSESLSFTLDPQGQIQTIVESAHDWFKSMGSESATLRVALYTVEEGYLQVLASTDGTHRDAVQTPNKENQKEHYKVSPIGQESTQALVVKVFNENKPKIISDTVNDRDFNFFTDHQSNYLRSIVATPLRERAESSPFGVLAVDANISGYFQPESGIVEQIVILGDEIALRLSLELAMIQYLDIE